MTYLLQRLILAVRVAPFEQIQGFRPHLIQFRVGQCFQFGYWGGGIALFALFFGGSIRETVFRIMIMRQMQMRPSPVGPPPTAKPGQPGASPKPVNLPAPGAPASTSATAPAASDPSFERVTGVWEGIGAVPPNSCTLKLEIRPKEGDTFKLAGFPVLNCFPIVPPLFRGRDAQQQLIARFAPMSSVLTGTAEKGSVLFTLDKVIGKTPDGCSIEGMIVTPFGVDQLSAEWKDDTCKGGQTLLRKSRG